MFFSTYFTALTVSACLLATPITAQAPQACTASFWGWPGFVSASNPWGAVLAPSQSSSLSSALSSKCATLTSSSVSAGVSKAANSSGSSSAGLTTKSGSSSTSIVGTPTTSVTTQTSSIATSAASPTSSSPNGSRASSSDISSYHSLHNNVRSQHSASNLVWNNSLAAAAQRWSDGCAFKHSGGTLGPYGENLAAGTGSGYTITSAVNAWTSEVSQYNASNPQASHYTQVVWKATTQLGCALTSCAGGTIFPASYGSANYVVCEYYPQGNVIGKFPQNVS